MVFLVALDDIDYYDVDSMLSTDRNYLCFIYYK